MNPTSLFRSLLLVTVVGFFGCTAEDRSKSDNGLDRSSEAKIDSLLRVMTLEEKIGQLALFTSDWDVTGPTLRSDYKDLIKEGKVGAVFNAYTVDYNRELQRMAVEESRLGIPLMFGYDVIHGHRTIFPIPLGQAASWNMESIRKSERIAALEASAEGITWTFAPMVDVGRDPRWGRVSEGAGEDTWLLLEVAKARVQGFQGDDLSASNTVMACAKHFAAYGAPQGGRDYHTVDMSMLSLYEWYLPPFKACLDAGVGSFMTSFNEINGVPATSNSWLLKELLRRDWGFNGFVVTDYTSINELVPHGVATTEKDAAALALNAGVDMDMQGSVYLDHLKALLDEGKIQIEQINFAVRNVLTAKARLGLFDDPYRYLSNERQENEIMTAEYREFARQFVAESCVLLKNENQTLPIPASIGSIAVIGPLGDSKKDMLGNWSAAGQWDKCVTLMEGIRNRVGDRVDVTYVNGCNTTDNNTDGFGEAKRVAGKADFVILALGENGWMSGEAASKTNIDLPGAQNALMEAVLEVGKPTAVVLFNGRPMAISNLAEKAPAILETWFGGTEAGNGIADVLFGDYNPAGKLTMTFPRNVGQIPIFYNVKNTGRPVDPSDPDYKYRSRYIDSPKEPLFVFGHGLSYTTFEYSGLDVSVSGDGIDIAVQVQNTGEMDGEEVVQLYVQDLVGSITRPLKELKGFKKIMIKKGESETINFQLTRDDLAFYHPDLQKRFEPGDFTIFVGTDSENVLSRTVTID
jgi:beta-glucosidase